MKGQFIVREDIVLASAAARPATLLLASTGPVKKCLEHVDPASYRNVFDLETPF